MSSITCNQCKNEMSKSNFYYVKSAGRYRTTCKECIKNNAKMKRQKQKALPYHTVYALCDPDTKEVRYIGLTFMPQTRLSEHVAAARILANNNASIYTWIRSLLKDGKRPTLVRLCQVNPPDAPLMEKTYYKWARQLGCDLTNNPDRLGVGSLLFRAK